MRGEDKLAIAVGLGALALWSMNRNAPGTAGARASTAQDILPTAPVILPEGSLSQEAYAWYDRALSALGYSGTFQQRLVAFQDNVMHAPATDHYHLTQGTQQAIQDAVRTMGGVTATSDELNGGYYRSRY